MISIVQEKLYCNTFRQNVLIADPRNVLSLHTEAFTQPSPSFRPGIAYYGSALCFEMQLEVVRDTCSLILSICNVCIYFRMDQLSVLKLMTLN